MTLINVEFHKNLQELLVEIRSCFDNDLSDLGGILWRLALQVCQKENIKSEKISFALTVEFVQLTQASWPKLHLHCDKASASKLMQLCEYLLNKRIVSDHCAALLAVIGLSDTTFPQYCRSDVLTWENVQDAIRNIASLQDQRMLHQQLSAHINETTLYFFLADFRERKSKLNNSVLLLEQPDYLPCLLSLSLDMRKGHFHINWPTRCKDLKDLRAPLIHLIENNEYSKDHLHALQRAQQKFSEAIALKLKQWIEFTEIFLDRIHGKPPCPYSVLVVGSLARGEMGVFSDFEFIIVLPEDIKGNGGSYFKELVKLIHWQIELLGESGRYQCYRGFHIDVGISPFCRGEQLDGNIGKASVIWRNAVGDNYTMHSLLNATHLWGDQELSDRFHNIGKQQLLQNDQIELVNSFATPHQQLALELYQEHQENLQKFLNVIMNTPYLDPKVNILHTVGMMAHDMALFLKLNIQGMSTQTIIQQLIDQRYICPVFGAIWQEAVRLAQALKLSAENHAGQATKPSLIIMFDPEMENALEKAKQLASRPRPDQYITQEMLVDMQEEAKRRERENFSLYCIPTKAAQLWQKLLKWIAIPLSQFNIFDITADKRCDPLLQTLLQQQLFLTAESKWQLAEILIENIPQGLLKAYVNKYHDALAIQCFLMWQHINKTQDPQKTPAFYDYWERVRLEFVQLLEKSCEQARIDAHSILQAFVKVKDDRGESLANLRDHHNWVGNLSSLCCGTQEIFPRVAIRSVLIKNAFLSNEVINWLINNSYLDGLTGQFRFELTQKQVSNHLVIPLPQGYHLKVYPEYPMMEASINLLAELLFGKNFLPETDFWRWECCVNDKVKRKAYPVQVSKTQKGLPLNQILSNTPDALDYLSEEDFARWFLLTLIIDPEDAKPDNFIGEWMGEGKERRLKVYCVDNDRAFVPPFSQTLIRIKSIFYYCNQMNRPLSKKVCLAFSRLQSAAIINHWFSKMMSLNNQYLSTYQEEINQFNQQPGIFSFGREDHNRSIAALLVKKQLACHILEKIQIMQEKLISTDLCIPTELLKHFYPELAQYNGFYLQEECSPYIRYIGATKLAYDHQKDSCGIMYSKTTSEFDLYLKELYGGKIPEKISLASHQTLIEAQEFLKQMIEGKNTKEIVLQRLTILNEPTPGIVAQLFENLSSSALVWVLDGIVWTLLSENQQSAIFSFLGNARGEMLLKLHTIGSLQFIGSLVDNQMLVKLLIKFPNLYSLKVQRCIKLTDNILADIIAVCPHLEEADLSETNITGIWKPYRYPKQQLACNALKYLKLDNCLQLITVDLEVPKIETLLANDCVNLRKICFANINMPNWKNLSINRFSGALYIGTTLTASNIKNRYSEIKKGEGLSAYDLTLIYFASVCGVLYFEPVEKMVREKAKIRHNKLNDQEEEIISTYKSLLEVTLFNNHIVEFRDFINHSIDRNSCIYEYLDSLDLRLSSSLYSAIKDQNGIRIPFHSFICVKNNIQRDRLAIGYLDSNDYSDQYGILIWSIRNNNIVRYFPKITAQPICRMAYSPDGIVAYSTANEKIFFLDDDNVYNIYRLRECRFPLVFSLAKKIFACSSKKDHIIYLVNNDVYWKDRSDYLVDGVYELSGHTDKLLDLAFLNDDVLISSSIDETIRIWSCEVLECLKIIKLHEAVAYGLCISSKLQQMAIWNGYQITLYDLKTYEIIKTLLDSELKDFAQYPQTYELTFSPSGAELTIMDGNYALVFNVENGELWSYSRCKGRVYLDHTTNPQIGLIQEKAITILSEPRRYTYFSDKNPHYAVDRHTVTTSNVIPPKIYRKLKKNNVVINSPNSYLDPCNVTNRFFGEKVANVPKNVIYRILSHLREQSIDEYMRVAPLVCRKWRDFIWAIETSEIPNIQPKI